VCKVVKKGVKEKKESDEKKEELLLCNFQGVSVSMNVTTVNEERAWVVASFVLSFVGFSHLRSAHRTQTNVEFSS
jgi:hypothetical protein